MRITIESFRCHRKLVLEFRDSKVHLISGNSGRGKSSVFEAIYWCLYKKIVKVAPITEGKLRTSVEISLPGLTIFRQNGPNIFRVTKNGITYESDSADALIEDLFGDANFWLATSYLRQDALHILIAGSATEKIGIINRLAFRDENPGDYIAKVDTELQVSSEKVTALSSEFKTRLDILRDNMERRNVSDADMSSAPSLENGISLEQANAHCSNLENSIRELQQLSDRITGLKINAAQIDTQGQTPESITDALYHLQQAAVYLEEKAGYDRLCLKKQQINAEITNTENKLRSRGYSRESIDLTIKTLEELKEYFAQEQIYLREKQHYDQVRSQVDQCKSRITQIQALAGNYTTDLIESELRSLDELKDYFFQEREYRREKEHYDRIVAQRDGIHLALTELQNKIGGNTEDSIRKQFKNLDELRSYFSRQQEYLSMVKHYEELCRQRDALQAEINEMRSKLPANITAHPWTSAEISAAMSAEAKYSNFVQRCRSLNVEPKSENINAEISKYQAWLSDVDRSLAMSRQRVERTRLVQELTQRQNELTETETDKVNLSLKISTQILDPGDQIENLKQERVVQSGDSERERYLNHILSIPVVNCPSCSVNLRYTSGALVKMEDYRPDAYHAELAELRRIRTEKVNQIDSKLRELQVERNNYVDQTKQNNEISKQISNLEERARTYTGQISDLNAKIQGLTLGPDMDGRSENELLQLRSAFGSHLGILRSLQPVSQPSVSSAQMNLQVFAFQLQQREEQLNRILENLNNTPKPNFDVRNDLQFGSLGEIENEKRRLDSLLSCLRTMQVQSEAYYSINQQLQSLKVPSLPGTPLVYRDNTAVKSLDQIEPERQRLESFRRHLDNLRLETDRLKQLNTDVEALNFPAFEKRADLTIRNLNELEIEYRTLESIRLETDRLNKLEQKIKRIYGNGPVRPESSWSTLIEIETERKKLHSIQSRIEKLQLIETEINQLEIQFSSGPGLQNLTTELIRFRESIERYKILVDLIADRDRLIPIYTELQTEQQKNIFLAAIRQKMIDAEYSSYVNIAQMINEELRSTVRGLFVDPIDIRLSMFKTLKSQKRIKPTVNLIILSRGEEIDFNAMSGGEKRRICLGLTLALAKLGSSPMLLLDEVLANLSEEDRELVFPILQAAGRMNKTILCASHGGTSGWYDSEYELKR